jgi:pilus assembly protein Flp/PilA
VRLQSHDTAGSSGRRLPEEVPLKFSESLFNWFHFFKKESNMLLKIRGLLRNKKGQGLAEYGLLVAAIIIMSLAAVSIYGHKTSDMWAVGASLLPGAHADDLGPIQSGKLVATTDDGSNTLVLDVSGVTGGTGNNLGTQLGISAASLAVEP